MYSKIPSAKAFIDIFFRMNIEKLAKKHKKEIERYVYPNDREMVLRKSEARKIIQAVRKIKITELNIELELHYIDCCLEMIKSFGYLDEKYTWLLKKCTKYELAILIATD